MRNWKPYIADVVKQMRTDGITSAAAICLAPQNSRTSVGLYRRAAFAEAVMPSSSNLSRAGPTILCSPGPSPRGWFRSAGSSPGDRRRKSRYSSPRTACLAGRSRLQSATRFRRHASRTREDFLAGRGYLPFLIPTRSMRRTPPASSPSSPASKTRNGSSPSKAKGNPEAHGSAPPSKTP